MSDCKSDTQEKKEPLRSGYATVHFHGWELHGDTHHAQSLIVVNGYMMTAQRHDNTNRVAKSNRKNV